MSRAATTEDTNVTATTFTHQLLRGVDLYRGRLRVRLAFKGLPNQPHTEYFAATEPGKANARILELRERRAAGVAPDTTTAMTLGEAATELLERRLLEVSPKTDRVLSEGGAAWQVRITKPWREGPFAATPVHLLNPAAVAKAHRERALAHPKSARDELAALKATLELARAEGCKIPERLLSIRPPAVHVQREREALTDDQLELLVSCAPARYQRLVAIHGRVGNRIGELLTLAPSRVNLDPRRPALTIPAELCKERRTKQIPLLPAEVALLAAELRELPEGAELVWPHPEGRAWPTTEGRVAHAYFKRLVWQPAIVAAQAAWRELHGGGATPYDTLTSHDLRVTAVTAMRDQGVSEETTAFRVGHADTTLVRAVYDQGDRAERAALELEALSVRGAASATATTAPTAHLEGRS